jgi:hypothetical protein
LRSRQLPAADVSMRWSQRHAAAVDGDPAEPGRRWGGSESRAGTRPRYEPRPVTNEPRSLCPRSRQHRQRVTWPGAGRAGPGTDEHAPPDRSDAHVASSGPRPDGTGPSWASPGSAWRGSAHPLTCWAGAGTVWAGTVWAGTRGQHGSGAVTVRSASPGSAASKPAAAGSDSSGASKQSRNVVGEPQRPDGRRGRCSAALPATPCQCKQLRPSFK